MVDPEVTQRSVALEGFELFIDYVFSTFGFRKLYADVLDFNLAAFSHQEVFVEEGRLVAHEQHAGRWSDLVYLALWRDAWDSRPRLGAELASRYRSVRESERS